MRRLHVPPPVIPIEKLRWVATGRPDLYSVSEDSPPFSPCGAICHDALDALVRSDEFSTYSSHGFVAHSGRSANARRYTYWKKPTDGT